MNLRAEAYNQEKHEGFLQAWLVARGLPTADPNFLPPTGFIVSFYDKPICVGFMVKCDNKTAIYQDFVSDPDSPKMVRNLATEHLRAALDVEAKLSGLQAVLCTTAFEAHSERLKKIGYAELDRNLIQLGRFLWL